MAGNPALYQQYAAKYAQMYGVPTPILEAQIGQESGWNPNARSGAGAEGIAQFMPSTAAGVHLRSGHVGINPYDPQQALEGAAAYDAGLLHKYGNVQSMLSAYNSGNPNAYRDPHFAGGQTYNYVRSIMSKAGKSGASFRGMSPKGMAGLQQGLAAQSGGVDNVAASRSALLQNLIGQENSYLTGQDYTGPSMVQSMLQMLQAQRQQAPPSPGLMQGTPLVAGSGRTFKPGGAGGFIPAGAIYKQGRIDGGRDFQTSPGGPIIAPGSGRVISIKSDPGGFGPSYPVVQFTSGPYAGRTMYLGHTLAALKPGARFSAGQVLSHTGRTPIGNASVPGWAEIGYAPGGLPGGLGQQPPF